MTPRFKSSKILPFICLCFLAVVMIGLLILGLQYTHSDTTANAADNSQTQHFTAMLHDRIVVSTKDGYPVYNVIFIRQDGAVFDYYGSNDYVNSGDNHMQKNALYIYTKGQIGANYAIDMDNNGNIVAIKGMGF